MYDRLKKFSGDNLLFKPLMPKGVEHTSVSLVIFLFLLFLFKPLMPKGVEHNDSSFMDFIRAKLFKPLMPKGVEHLAW